MNFIKKIAFANCIASMNESALINWLFEVGNSSER